MKKTRSSWWRVKDGGLHLDAAPQSLKVCLFLTAPVFQQNPNSSLPNANLRSRIWIWMHQNVLLRNCHMRRPKVIQRLKKMLQLVPVVDGSDPESFKRKNAILILHLLWWGLSLWCLPSKRSWIAIRPFAYRMKQGWRRTTIDRWQANCRRNLGNVEPLAQER